MLTPKLTPKLLPAGASQTTTHQPQTGTTTSSLDGLVDWTNERTTLALPQNSFQLYYIRT